MQVYRSAHGIAALLVALSLLPGCQLVSGKVGGDLGQLASSWQDGLKGWLETSPAKSGVKRLRRGAEEPVEYVSRQPSRADLLVAWGRALEQAGRIEEATEAFEEAVKESPRSKEALSALARNYAMVGRPEAALQMYKRAVRVSPRDAALRNNLGLHLAEMGRWDEAIAELRKAVELEETTSKYHNNLGLVLAMAGRYEEALEEFRAAVGPAKAYYNLAQARLFKGDRAGALVDLKKALALNHDLMPARELLKQLEPGAVTKPAAVVTAGLRSGPRGKTAEGKASAQRPEGERGQRPSAVRLAERTRHDGKALGSAAGNGKKPAVAKQAHGQAVRLAIEPCSAPATLSTIEPASRPSRAALLGSPEPLEPVRFASAHAPAQGHANQDKSRHSERNTTAPAGWAALDWLE